MHIAAGNGQFGLVKYFAKNCQMDPQTVNEVRCVDPLVCVSDVVCMIKVGPSIDHDGFHATLEWMEYITLCITDGFT